MNTIWLLSRNPLVSIVKICLFSFGVVGNFLIVSRDTFLNGLAGVSVVNIGSRIRDHTGFWSKQLLHPRINSLISTYKTRSYVLFSNTAAGFSDSLMRLLWYSAIIWGQIFIGRTSIFLLQRVMIMLPPRDVSATSFVILFWGNDPSQSPICHVLGYLGVLFRSMRRFLCP